MHDILYLVLCHVWLTWLNQGAFDGENLFEGGMILKYIYMYIIQLRVPNILVDRVPYWKIQEVKIEISVCYSMHLVLLSNSSISV